MALDPGGNAVVAGSYSGTLAIGDSRAMAAGPTNGFIAKLDRDSGRVLWLRTLGGSSRVEIHSIAISPADGGIAFGGEFAGRISIGGLEILSAGAPDGLIGVLSNDGTPRWGAGFGGTRFASVTGVAILASGDLGATGYFGGSLTHLGRSIFSGGGIDMFASRLRRAGGVVWTVRGGGPGADLGRAIAALPDGGAVITGSVMNGASFGPHTTTVESSASDLLVAAIDANGNYRYASHVGGEGNDSGASIAVGSLGERLRTIAGGKSVPALVSVNHSGELESATTLPDINTVSAVAIGVELYAAREVSNPAGTGIGAAITRGILGGRTETITIGATETLAVSSLAPRGDALLAAGNFRGELTIEKHVHKSATNAGFVVSFGRAGPSAVR